MPHTQKSLVFATLATAAMTFAVLSLAGCEKPQIARYQVLRESTDLSGKDATPAVSGPKTRMLAAMLPRGDAVWFFKFTGPRKLVDGNEQAFEAFLHSVRFADAEGPTWTTPKGWQEEGPSESRAGTLRVTDKGEFAELTVTRLGKIAAAVLPNVNRWRGQLGLPPIGPEQLAEHVRQVQTRAGEMTLVDLVGVMGGDRPGAGTMVSGGPATRPGAGMALVHTQRPAVEYLEQPGWRLSRKPGGMSAVTFEVGSQDRPARVTVVPLPGLAGGLLANVNQWREEVGLEPLSEDEVHKEVHLLPVYGRRGVYFRFYGPESAGVNRRGLLEVMVPDETVIWYVTMRGPADVVADEEEAFEAFARSLHFPTAPRAS